MREAIISFPMFGQGFSLDPPSYISIGSFKIYFYGIIIALGFVLAILYASKTCRRFDMKMDDVYDYLIWATVCAIICARLYYVVFYFSWEQIKADPMSVFRIRDGGIAIYGGVIGAVLGLALRARMRKDSLYPELDVMSLGLLIGQLVGRWGNFFNREAYGYETDIFCRMGLTTASGTVYVHPTFLYESLWNLLGLILLHIHSKSHRRYQGQYFLLYVIWYGIGRAMIEGLRSDSLWLVPDVIRVSQLLAVVTAAAALCVYILNSRRLAAGSKPLFGALPAGPESETGPDAGESVDESAPEAPGESTAAEAVENSVADIDECDIIEAQSDEKENEGS